MGGAMFTRRRALDKRRHYTQAFLVTLASRLRDAGFDQVTIILPHNYASVDPKASEVSLDDFLMRERNYAAVILRAVASERKEVMKVLFINSNAKAIFVDDTFPMAESEPSGLYFQSPDPGRAYAVFEYFFEYLSQPSIAGFVLLTLSSMVATVVLLLEILVFIGQRKGFLAFRFGYSPLADFLVSFMAAWIAFRFAAAPTGLWVKPKRELRLLYLANMAMKGQLRDNPLVQVLLTVIGGLIVAYVAKLLGWI
jgi:hypothetical protein